MNLFDDDKADATGPVLKQLRVEGVAQVPDAPTLDAFLAARGVDVAGVTQELLFAEEWGTNRRSHEDAVGHLLKLHHPPLYLPENGVAISRLAVWIRTIQQDLNPTDGLLAHLCSQARILGTTRVQAAGDDPGRILDAIKGGELSIDGEYVQADYMERMPLKSLLNCFRSDGRLLWEFRDAFRLPIDELDSAIAANWCDFRGGILKGLLSFFDKASYSVTPLKYLNSFPKALREPAHLYVVMREFARHIRCVDGFRQGYERDEWLAAVGCFRCWANPNLRQLATLEHALKDRPDAYLNTLLMAVQDGWERDRGAAAFGALALMRGYRVIFAENRKLVDEVREGEFRLSLTALEGGDDLLRIADLCADLPLGLHNESSVWLGLTPPIKAHWRKRVAAAAEGSREFGDALVTYILAWTSKDVYSDVEPLIFDLHRQHDRSELLVTLAATAENIAATRAAYLLDEFDVHPPARNCVSPV